MNRKMHPKQLENVFALNSKERYEHFVGRVCDWQELWILENAEENFLIVSPKESEIEYMPVWPEPEYAIEFAKVDGLTYTPKKVEVSAFIDKWLPGLKEDGIKVGVLPNLETTVWIVEPSDLKSDLEEGLAEYE